MSDAIAKVLSLCSSSFFLLVGGVPRDFTRKHLTQNLPIFKSSPCIYKLSSSLLLEFISSCKDIDISTTLLPKEVGKILDETFPNISRKRNFATNLLTVDGYNIEITSTRIDKECDGKNAKMKHNVSFFKDSNRRDFTFNALYMQSNGTVFDFHNGIEDLKYHKINFIGDPKQRLEEDCTRIKRYYNFCQRFNLHNTKIEEAIDYIKSNATKPIIMR